MQISIQDTSRPVAVPSAGLGVLSYNNLPAPSSGVQAALAGTEEGQAIAAPLAQEGLYLDNYFSPGVSAQRQAQIATAGLQTTNANQENAAAKATPTLPLALRNNQVAQAAADATIISPRADAAKAQLGQIVQETPSKTAADIGANRVGVLNSGNVLYTEPNYAPGVESDQQATDWFKTYAAQHPDNAPILDSSTPQGLSAIRGLYDQNNQGVAATNAITQAKEQAAVRVAGIPQLPEGVSGNVHRYWDGTKMAVEQTHPVPLVGPDGKTHTYEVGADTGQKYNDLGISGAQNNMDQRYQRQLDTLAARNGYVDPSNTNAALKAIADNASADPNLGPKAATRAAQVGTQFMTTARTQYIPKFQMISGIDAAAKTAQDPNTTGAADVDLIEIAGRLNNGGQLSDAKFNALKNASGIPDLVWNTPAKLENGKYLTPQVRQDIINIAQNYKSNLINSYQRDYDSAAGKLPEDADPTHYLGPRDYGVTASPQAAPQGQPTDQDQQAIQWAKANPNDPRSAQILKVNGQ